MIQINLLPWREKARLQKKKQFGYTVGVFILITICFVLMIHLHYASLIRAQNKRNAFIQTAVGTENQLLLKLQDDIKKGKESDDQLRFLVSLRNHSYSAIRFLDDLTRVTPEGIRLTQISWNNSSIIIFGKAVSDFQVTLLMKNMTASRIFNQPELSKIDSKSDNSDGATLFQLNVTQKEEAYP